jgi:hypothetical protein
VYVVLDNHPAHHTLLVTDEAARLNFELMFMPPYSPELNAIEALWSVLKRNVKQQLVMRKLVNITQVQFEVLLQGCLDNIVRRFNRQQRNTTTATSYCSAWTHSSKSSSHTTLRVLIPSTKHHI